MRKLKKYFQSFDSAIKLLYTLNIQFRLTFYRFFGSYICKNLENKVVICYEDKLFSDTLNTIISWQDNIFETVDTNEADCIIFEADRYVQGIFDLLGSGDKKLDPIQWHTDFKTGFCWKPGTFYKDYIQESINTNADVKVPRELSRCHHFLKLGLAYHVTKNEQYAVLCVGQMDDWIKENPLMRSINWGCTMDVAIRAVNWIWALGLILNSESVPNNDIEKIKVSLYEHGWFIYRNPEKNAYNNHNHYLADLASQIHLGLLFKGMPEPKKWLEQGIKELFKEIRMQILPTGMSYERSTGYNRLVLELVLVPILLLKKNGYEIPSDIWYRIEKMFEFIMYSLKPDGTTPIVGDQDDGRLLPFGSESNINYRYLLSLGSILFNRSDFKQFGNGYNIYCLLLGGISSKEKYDKIPLKKNQLPSAAFPDAGFYIMRSHFNYLIFNASGKGLYPELPSGTHTHSDLLSFELCVNGKTFLVDPGSYVYTADAEQRMLFRSTKMHNTVTVDNESQNILRKEVLWDFEKNATPEILLWESDEIHDLVVGQHTGYLRLNRPVIHKRSVYFNKQDLTWQITDELLGEGSHQFDWFFHFDEKIDFQIENNEVITTCADNPNIIMQFYTSATIRILKEDTWVSKAYGSKNKALLLHISTEAICPLKFETRIRKK